MEAITAKTVTYDFHRTDGRSHSTEDFEFGDAIIQHMEQ
jgi:isocitrate dehydrogenase